jgi:hypothetical protein
MFFIRKQLKKLMIRKIERPKNILRLNGEERRMKRKPMKPRKLYWRSTTNSFKRNQVRLFADLQPYSLFLQGAPKRPVLLLFFGENVSKSHENTPYR